MESCKILYRYDSYFRGDDMWRELVFYITTYSIIRETEKCYVIKNPEYPYHSQKETTFVLKSHNGKRFAYDTQEAAYEGYLHRCRRRELIARRMQKNAEEVLRGAQNKEKLLSLKPRNNQLQ